MRRGSEDIKMRNTIVLIILIVLCTGCSRNLSNVEPYKTLIGREVQLVRETELRQFVRHGKPVRGKPFDLKEPDPHSTDSRLEHFAILPAGTKLRIASVKAISYFGPEILLVNGAGVLPETGNEFRWTFRWGHFDRQWGYISRAPWEDNAVPNERALRERGTVIGEQASDLGMRQCCPACGSAAQAPAVSGLRVSDWRKRSLHRMRRHVG
jgi:hypothetical protein